MKSNSAGPDFVRMSRFRAAMDAWLRSISSVTMAGSVSIGAGAPPGGGPPGRLVRERRDEVAAVEDGLQRVPDQRIGLPQHRPGGRRGSPARPGAWVTSTNSLPPASCIGAAVVSCHNGEPERLHGVGHHLLVTDGEVDVVLLRRRPRGWGTAW